MYIYYVRVYMCVCIVASTARIARPGHVEREDVQHQLATLMCMPIVSTARAILV